MAYAAEPAATPARSPSTPALAAIGAATAAAGDTAAAPVPAAMPDYLRQARAGDAIPSTERKCLATAVYFEARGEPVRGQVAVAQVVLNRTESPRYPDSICGVVYQNDHRRDACQFSFACDGLPDEIAEKQAWARAWAIANAVTSGEKQIEELGTATHYHATYVAPYWAASMRRLATIGAHVFYRT